LRQGKRGLGGFELPHGSAELFALLLQVERLRDAVGDGGAADGSRRELGFEFS
jgi:hypothetical protein